jgi:hypothetical protein
MKCSAILRRASAGSEPTASPTAVAQSARGTAPAVTARPSTSKGRPQQPQGAWQAHSPLPWGKQGVGRSQSAAVEHSSCGVRQASV